MLQRAEFVEDSSADGPRLQVPSSPKSYRPDADRIASDVSRKACEPHVLSSGKSAAVRCGRTYPRHRGARLLHRADFDAGRIHRTDGGGHRAGHRDPHFRRGADHSAAAPGRAPQRDLRLRASVIRRNHRRCKKTQTAGINKWCRETRHHCRGLSACGQRTFYSLRTRAGNMFPAHRAIPPKVPTSFRNLCPRLPPFQTHRPLKIAAIYTDTTLKILCFDEPFFLWF